MNFRATATSSVVVIDNYDSFVFTLVAYLRELEVKVEVIEGAEFSVVEAIARVRASSGVLIALGPGRPEDVPTSLTLVEYAVANSHALLGVCLGLQVIVAALGGRVLEAPELIHGQTSPIVHKGDPLFAGLPSGFAAMRYHPLAAERSSLPAALEVTATSPEGVGMGVRHRDAPLVGVQFHLESVLTEGGFRLLANWLSELNCARSNEIQPTMVSSKQ
ncbi:anthranilate synthase component II [Rathayibacter toxicus]|uniref:anthranilate synthase component II n=1 Tax=Rathayibacter toxicus TaxID=145458 RepID=UPI000CE7C5DC|nr:gamma-glutamyl-gamma-aminobutyrate hydrolase family protein [Rathayibacter toxicus]PPI56785.1 anthranilate synthase component II [Rathayibacter toxicus]QOD10453.1 gamma-glutamyl-gamma-aminobutyrate hydrolase family protein [Rathayibacter toxicus]QWL27190.1 anthranilate synthase component II [Rathayibacter toxicus]